MTTTRYWVFTFGFGQSDPKTGLDLGGHYVKLPVEVDDDGHPTDLEFARRQMLARFGRQEHGGNWAFDYPDEEAAGVARFGLIEIDFVTGDSP